MDQNFFQTLGQVKEPSYMEPSFMQAPTPQQVFTQNPQGFAQTPPPEQPRKRASVLDVIGRVADTFAEMGGATPMYQRNVDSQLQREREAELHPLEKQKLQFGNQKAAMETADARTELLGRAYMALKNVRDRYGDEGYRQVAPNMARVFGLSPEDTAFVTGNPDQAMEFLKGLAESGANGDEYGLALQTIYNPETGETRYIQARKSGGAQSVGIPEGFIPAPGVTSQDVGDRVITKNVKTGAVIDETPKAGGPEKGEIPIYDENNNIVGYRLASGSKAEAEATAAEEERQAGLAAADRGEEDKQRQADIVLNRIGVIESKADKFGATGFFSPGVKYVPGSAAYDVNSALETIRANIGFDALQRMRDNSPTGGALGQVAVREIELLQAVLTSLDQAQSPEQFLTGLKELKSLYSDIINGSKEQQEAIRKRQKTTLRTTPNSAPPSATSTDGWSYVGPKK